MTAWLKPCPDGCLRTPIFETGSNVEESFLGTFRIDERIVPFIIKCRVLAGEISLALNLDKSKVKFIENGVFRCVL